MYGSRSEAGGISVDIRTIAGRRTPGVPKAGMIKTRNRGCLPQGGSIGGTSVERDRDGEPFQDDFTENRGPSGSESEDVAEQIKMDPDVDSEDDDRTMKHDAFGVNGAGVPAADGG